MTAKEMIALLKLEPHPVEGGYFRRTYTAAGRVELARGERKMGSAIYYLLETGTFSEMHVLKSDELFHFYLGDAVEMLELLPDGTSRVTVLGPDLAAGEQVQHLVPAGVWQGARLLDGGEVFVPEFATASPEGQYVIEGHGVDPDIEVENDPLSVIAGRDPQLERAIAEIEKALVEHPKVLPQRPPDPDKAPKH